MDRRFRFRAWDKKTNTWVSVNQLDKGIIINPFTSTRRAGQFDLSEYDTNRGVGNEIGTAIILMEYTGLVDNKGLEICEDDIIETQHGRYRVIWLASQSRFTAQKGQIYIRSDNWVKHKIIGNIHENPKLLKA